MYTYLLSLVNKIFSPTIFFTAARPPNEKLTRFIQIDESRCASSRSGKTLALNTCSQIRLIAKYKQ